MSRQSVSNTIEEILKSTKIGVKKPLGSQGMFIRSFNASIIISCIRSSE
jgi:hypothetical protein